MMLATERSACDRWMEDALVNQPPCSMRVDGRPLSELVASWKRAHSAVTDADGVRRDTLTLTDPASGLECRLEFLRRPGSPAVEWVTVLTNRGSQRSPLLENLRSLDLSMTNPPQTPAHLVHSQGTHAKIDDFALNRSEVTYWQPIALESYGSRGHLPFMTLDLGERGITAGLGWIGRWCAKAVRTKEGVTSLEMGLLKAHLRLEPGEEIRLPRVLLLFWEKDWRRGGNLLRRHLVAHYLPRGADGQVIPPPICCATWGGMKTKNHVSLIRTIQEQRLDFDVYWMDAGWYGRDHETEEFQNFHTEDWAYHQGDWRVNRCVHPDGLAPIVAAAGKTGMQVLLWFGPYNARQDSEIVLQHPEWVTRRWGDGGVGMNKTPARMCTLDLARDEVRDHLVEQISALIKEHHVQWFRDDGGLPLPPDDRDPPDRQGMGEIRCVHNFYAFWDELLKRHPGLMIDNCGGGGTRIDLETISRSQVLHRTDYNCHPEADPIGMQVGTYGLSHWVPLIGGGAPARPGDTYNFRSAWCGGLPFSLFHPCGFGDAPIAPAADYPIAWHRRMIEDYRQARKYYIGDFYPLSGDSASDRDWFAYQMHRADLDEGLVMALRRPRSAFTTADFILSGLDPSARYEIRDLDGGPSIQADGATLMESGLHVIIDQHPGSVVRIYRACDRKRNDMTALTNKMAAEAASAQPANAQTDSRATTLPFAWTVNARKVPLSSDKFDYPVRQAVIDGDVWVIYVQWGDHYKERGSRVVRLKGPDLEHLQRQPDGVCDFGGASGHMGCGLWWDAELRTLYALVHSEYAINKSQGWCSKKTRLAMSTDFGLTWELVGDILTRALPDVQDYSGSCFEAGPADFDFYADEREGYFYVTCWNSFAPKNGKLNGFLMYSEVARCAIADKMAPGKWFKFRDGAWTEPGLGGKASRVGFSLRGMYGNTIYSKHLEKYLRIGVLMGISDERGMPAQGFDDRSICISACTDLAKQDWSPMAKLFDEPGNAIFGFTLADAKGVDPVACGQTLLAFNYWTKERRTLEINLKEGSTPARYFPPHDSYNYEPHPDSGDRIESRKTKIVGAAAPEVKFDGAEWAAKKNEHYYEGQGMVAAKAGHTIRFTFQGPDIYWRAVAANDGGKADVFIDDTLQETVDCFFPECPLPYQFAFIRTGLDPKRPHTIRIVVRGDKNAASEGTTIRHIGFEVSRTTQLNPLDR